jgi:uncharacterized protein YutE (UPF0331/DUF86 family)
MRNILVHGYEKIDDQVIYKSIKKILKDIPQFIKEVEKIKL